MQKSKVKITMQNSKFQNKIVLIKNNQKKIRKISDTYSINNLLTSDITKQISVAIGSAKNHKEITLNKKSNRVYYILKGKLIIKSKEKEFIGKVGDVIFIPKNTEYYFKGTFSALIINSPAFERKYEKSRLNF